ncbi:Hypothetical predicted protein [Scomber scombrus]|uniref:Uncharacterized protein n=1 Tax=Scomber scombrus TaxID=13677 RepID=A0AAV1PX79_SCOSC
MMSQRCSVGDVSSSECYNNMDPPHYQHLGGQDFLSGPGGRDGKVHTGSCSCRSWEDRVPREDPGCRSPPQSIRVMPQDQNPHLHTTFRPEPSSTHNIQTRTLIYTQPSDQNPHLPTTFRPESSSTHNLQTRILIYTQPSGCFPRPEPTENPGTVSQTRSSQNVE